MSGTSNRMKLEWHQCKMVRIGRPRLPVDALQKLMAKQTGEPVASSMIVFGPMGRVYNLRLAPYFMPPPKPQRPKRQPWPTWRDAVALWAAITILAVIVSWFMQLRHGMSYASKGQRWQAAERRYGGSSFRPRRKVVRRRYRYEDW
jgi:hypothetical protein